MRSKYKAKIVPIEPEPAEPVRKRVDYRHDAINPEFTQFLARIGGYAAQQYSDPLQYLQQRMTADRGPINHALNHIGEYRMGLAHDHFGDDPRWQLAAAAYNLMMEFTYLSNGYNPDEFPVCS